MWARHNWGCGWGLNSPVLGSVRVMLWVRFWKVLGRGCVGVRGVR